MADPGGSGVLTPPPPLSGKYNVLVNKEYVDSLHNVTLSRPRIVIESLLEHFIFINFLGGGPKPPQGEVPTHKYLHHKILNPPFTNLIYTHVMTLCNYNSISI